jgi:MerR family copper efflux transcriptional regulator
MKQRMWIGNLTEQAKVTQCTVRTYECIGLLPPAERKGHGHHYSSEETLARLRKIDRLKQLGLSLDEIRDVIDLSFTDPSGIQPKQKALVILRKHLAEADRKISDLQQFRADLQTNIERFERFLAAKQQLSFFSLKHDGNVNVMFSSLQRGLARRQLRTNSLEGRIWLSI